MRQRPPDRPGAGTTWRLANVLSIDVEEWFHAENYSGVLPPERWDGFERRAADSVRWLLDLLDTTGVRATFFVLGWLAEREPALVAAIAAAGHEVASHGWSHTPLWRLDPARFAGEVRRTRALLGELSGQPIEGFRAPTFSVTKSTLWALGVLSATGHRYDSSIFPVHHDRYGIPSAPLELHRREEEGLWEVPLSVWELPRLRLPVAGGGYLRLFPRALTAHAIRRMNAQGRPAVVYVHPWEFDPGQPRVAGVGPLTTWRHHVGIPANREKLAWLLHEFPFAPAREVLRQVGAELQAE